MRTQRGFTFVELIVVMILVATLSAVALPGMFDTDHFAARGTRDTLGSSLRYAQKTAVAMRRNVCVAVSATQLDITYAATSGSGQACPATNVLVNPGNGKPYGDASNALPARTPVSPAVSFIFDAQGRPLQVSGAPLNAALTLTVTGYATPLTIEPGTGTVH